VKWYDRVILLLQTTNQVYILYKVYYLIDLHDIFHNICNICSYLMYIFFVILSVNVMVFWPTAWCIELSNTTYWPNVYLLTLFFLESFILHGAGLILNDIFDRSIDRQVIITITFLYCSVFHNTNNKKTYRF
jgi:hypothetical protein